MKADRRLGRLIAGLAILAIAGGCGTGSPPTPGTSATQTTAASATAATTPPATSTSAALTTPEASSSITFEEFHDSFCSSWEDLFRAVGNPDLGSGSDLTQAMDEAITTGDLATVDRLASEITSALEAGRRDVAHATGWTAAAPMMAEIDRVLVGYEAMTEAKRVAASQGLNTATRLGQEALQSSGAIDAWFALIRPGVLDETRAAIQSARPAGVPAQCKNVPVGL